MTDSVGRALAVLLEGGAGSWQGVLLESSRMASSGWVQAVDNGCPCGMTPRCGLVWRHPWSGLTIHGNNRPSGGAVKEVGGRGPVVWSRAGHQAPADAASERRFPPHDAHG